MLEGKDDSTTSGTFKTTPYEPHKQSFVHVKDCSEIYHSLDDVLAAKAPMSMLDGRILCDTLGLLPNLTR